jgi:hypothetical protein
MPELALELLLHPAAATTRAINNAIIGHLFFICDMLDTSGCYYGHGT